MQTYIFIIFKYKLYHFTPTLFINTFDIILMHFNAKHCTSENINYNADCLIVLPFIMHVYYCVPFFLMSFCKMNRN